MPPLQTRYPHFLKQQVTLAGSVVLLSPCPRQTCYGKVGAPSLLRLRAGGKKDVHMILCFEGVSSAGINDSFWKGGSQISCPPLQGSWSCSREIVESGWERVLTLPLKLRIRFSQVVQGCKGFPLFAWRVMLREWRVLLFQEGRTAPVQERHVAFVFLQKRGSLPFSYLPILRSRLVCS